MHHLQPEVRVLVVPVSVLISLLVFLSQLVCRLLGAASLLRLI